MKYSLLSRFRGALVGSLVGEMLGSTSYQDLVLGRRALMPLKSEEIQPSPLLSEWSQIATCGTQSLIGNGRLTLEEWVLPSGKTPSSLFLPSADVSSEVAVAMLPIALFFHEDEIKLRQNLLQAATDWQQKPEVVEGALAVAYAIALALTEKLNVTTLIPQIITALGTQETPFVQQLEQIQRLLEQGASLDTTLTQLRREAQNRNEPLKYHHTSVALAFYCFLSTPEDFRLCVNRAYRTHYHPQTTAALTGALAGVYNSIIGIPISWRLAANRISIGLHRLQLADRLLEVWSGVYDISASVESKRLTVAAPRVIQPR